MEGNLDRVDPTKFLNYFFELVALKGDQDPATSSVSSAQGPAAVSANLASLDPVYKKVKGIMKPLFEDETTQVAKALKA